MMYFTFCMYIIALRCLFSAFFKIIFYALILFPLFSFGALFSCSYLVFWFLFWAGMYVQYDHSTWLSWGTNGWSVVCVLLHVDPNLLLDPLAVDESWVSDQYHRQGYCQAGFAASFSDVSLQALPSVIAETVDRTDGESSCLPSLVNVGVLLQRRFAGERFKAFATPPTQNNNNKNK